MAHWSSTNYTRSYHILIDCFICASLLLYVLQIFPNDLITVRYFSTFDGQDFVQENGDYMASQHSTSIERRTDLNGRNLRLCTLPFPLTTMSDDGGKSFYGFSIDIIKALATGMNFTYSHVLPKDGHWGTQDEKTGSWNGMIGMLIDGKCDIW